MQNKINFISSDCIFNFCFHLSLRECRQRLRWKHLPHHRYLDNGFKLLSLVAFGTGGGLFFTVSFEHGML